MRLEKKWFLIKKADPSSLGNVFKLYDYKTTEEQGHSFTDGPSNPNELKMSRNVALCLTLNITKCFVFHTMLFLVK